MWPPSSSPRCVGTWCVVGRDPRIDPQAGDVLRLASGIVVQVRSVVEGHDTRGWYVSADDTRGRRWGVALDMWRWHVEGADVLWMDGHTVAPVVPATPRHVLLAGISGDD